LRTVPYFKRGKSDANAINGCSFVARQNKMFVNFF